MTQHLSETNWLRTHSKKVLDKILDNFSDWDTFESQILFSKLPDNVRGFCCDSSAEEWSWQNPAHSHIFLPYKQNYKEIFEMIILIYATSSDTKFCFSISSNLPPKRPSHKHACSSRRALGRWRNDPPRPLTEWTQPYYFSALGRSGRRGCRSWSFHSTSSHGPRESGGRVGGWTGR